MSRTLSILAAIGFAATALPSHSDELADRPPVVRNGRTRSANFSIDGAIVCRNLAMVAFMVQRMADGSQIQPNLKSSGCAMLPAGTPVTIEGEENAPTISGETMLGIAVRGVTDPAMVEIDKTR